MRIFYMKKNSFFSAIKTKTVMREKDICCFNVSARETSMSFVINKTLLMCKCARVILRFFFIVSRSLMVGLTEKKEAFFRDGCHEIKYKESRQHTK